MKNTLRIMCFVALAIVISAISVFAEDTYKITYDYGVADIRSEFISDTNPKNFTDGEKIILTEPSCSGFEFKGWYLDSSYDTPVTEIDDTFNADITLYAKWYEMSYNINYVITKSGFDINPENVHNSNITSRLASESTQLTAPEYNTDIYTFDGWYADADCTQKVTFIKEYTCEDVTLYANWKNTEFDIHYDMGDISHSVYTFENPNPDFYEYSDEIILLDASSKDPSYTFEGWYADEFFTEKITSIKKGTSGDVVIYAKWSAKQYNVTYILNEGSSISLDDIHNNNPLVFEATTGLILSAPLTDDKNFEFAGWYTSSDFNAESTAESIPEGTNNDVTLYAKWEKAVYSITYDYGIVSQIMLPIENPNATEYSFGDVITLTDISADGFIFNGWCKDPNLKEKITATDSETYGDITLYADFTEKTYSVTYVVTTENMLASQVVNTNATVRTTTQRVELEDAQTINKDFKFAGWYTDSEFTNKINYISGYTTGNITLYAKWIRATVYLPCWGDATLSEQLSAADARLILRYSAGLETGFTELQKQVSDINNDGKVNSIDARIVLRISAGLETEYEIKKLYSLPTIKVVDGEVVFR